MRPSLGLLRGGKLRRCLGGLRDGRSAGLACSRCFARLANARQLGALQQCAGSEGVDRAIEHQIQAQCGVLRSADRNMQTG